MKQPPTSWTTWENQLVDGRFALRRCLGQSDHSAVFLTEHKAKNLPEAAIKFVRADVSQAKPLLVHWQAAMGLSHPHLIQLFEVGRWQFGGNEFLFVVMEYGEQTLAEILRRRALTAEEVLELLPPALDALLFLHRRQLVHGRLQPSNLLAAGDQLKLSSDTIRPAGQDPGTSLAGDVWSFGATLIEALTQRALVAGDSPFDVTTLPGGLPAALLENVRRCLSPTPAERPTIIELRAEYKLAPPVEPAPRAKPPVQKGSREVAASQPAGDGSREGAQSQPAAAVSPAPASPQPAPGTSQAGARLQPSLSIPPRAAPGASPGVGAPQAATDVQRTTAPAQPVTNTSREAASAPPSPGSSREVTPPRATPGASPGVVTSQAATSGPRTTATTQPVTNTSREGTAAPPAPGISRELTPPRAVPGATPGVGASQAATDAQRTTAPAQPVTNTSREAASAPPSPGSSREVSPSRAMPGTSPGGVTSQVATNGPRTITPTQPLTNTSREGASAPTSPGTSREVTPPRATPGASPGVVTAQVATGGPRTITPTRPVTNTSQEAAPAPLSPSTSREATPPRVAPGASPGVLTSQAATSGARTTAPAVAQPQAAVGKSRAAAPSRREAPTTSIATPREELPTPSKSKRHLLISAIAAAALLSLAIWGGSRFTDSSQPQPTVTANPTPIAPPPTTVTVPNTSLSEPPRSEQPASPPASSVLHEVTPTVPEKILNKIQGRVYVTVRVLVDPEGTVIGALMENAGPSKYFARLSEEASRQWQFAPEETQESRVWLLRFEYTRNGVAVRTIEQ